jgi:two-component sensor histidine kinase
MTPSTLQSVEDARSAPEMNHRIANNLALLSAIVELDSRSVRDPEAVAVLAATQRRIRAVADVHRHLYREPSALTVDLGVFLGELADSLRIIVSDGGEVRRISVRADHFDLANEHAAAVAILVTELVGNACKHAYGVDVPGEVRVVFSADPGGAWSLTVEDDGVGMDHHGGGTRGLGSHIIQATSHQLRARHRWEAGSPGTRFLMWGEDLAGMTRAPAQIVVAPRSSSACARQSRS